MSDAGACNCAQAVELQSELAAARVRIAELELRAADAPECWHCGCALLPFKQHCFDCPAECDGCERCEWRRAGAAPVASIAVAPCPSCGVPGCHAYPVCDEPELRHGDAD